MDNKKPYTRGSISGIIIIVVLVSLSIYAGYWWGAQGKEDPLNFISNQINQLTGTSTIKTASSTPPTETIKTTTTKTVVKETPKAPVGKLYTDPAGDFTFRYPGNYVYEKEPLVPGEMGGYQYRFYESGADKNDEAKSFVITKRHLETYQINIGIEESVTGCSYDVATHEFKIASSYGGITNCENISSTKNNNGLRYFSTTGGGLFNLISRESFISEKKGIVVTIITSSNAILEKYFSESIKDLIIQSVLFK